MIFLNYSGVRKCLFYNLHKVFFYVMSNYNPRLKRRGSYRRETSAAPGIATALVLLFSVIAIPSLVLAASGPAVTMRVWSPGPGVISVGTPVTFQATGTDDDLVVQGFEWDFDGNGEPDAYSAADSPGKSSSGSIVRTFYAPATAYPAVRAVNSEGFVSVWDVYDVNGLPIQLVIGSSAPPKVTMNRWSPYSAAGPDGSPATSFTFSASASSDEGLARVEWDFDGDGNVDATSQVSGKPSVSATVDHVYGSPGSWVPKVRAVDVNGLPSLWAAYAVSGATAKQETTTTLDVAIPELAATLTFSQVGPATSDGANGSPSATYAFSVTSSANLTGYEWDFDGDGTVDATTSTPATQHTYRKYGLFLPTVTVNDAFGTRALVLPVGLNGRPAYIGVLGEAPVASMDQWSPFSAKGADGRTGMAFTFSAGASAQGGVQKFEWDFDGDGGIDLITAVEGAPASATATASYTFGREGNFTPQVRAVDATNQTSPWAFYGGSKAVHLDIAASYSQSAQPAIEKPLTEEKYCGGMTIEELIASGKYNVVDKRDSGQRMIFGTRGADLIIGSGAQNVILGRAGNDCIITGGGDDYAFGNEGDDIIFGSEGRDTINGGPGDDLIYGMAGNDSIKASSGDDKANGGLGNDTIDGGAGNDWCYGGGGNDADKAVSCETSAPFD
jgi:Ca2+-binding RTX toxin-like protein